MSTSTPAYKPRENSTGERALEFLKSRGRTMAKALAMELDLDVGAMGASLNLCVQHGLVERDVFEGNTYYDITEALRRELANDVQVQTLATPAEEREVDQFLPKGAMPIKPRPVSVFDGLKELENYQRPDETAAPLVSLWRHGESMASERVAAQDIDLGIAKASESNPVVDSAPVAAEKPRNKRQFSVGIFTDGRLVLQRGTPESGDSYEEMTLCRDELETLVGFIEKFGSIS